MGALTELASEIHAHLSGFGLVSSRSAWLKDDVTADSLEWQLDATTNSVGEGLAEIDDELVYVRNYVSASGALIIAPDGRGYDTTTPDAHAAGTRLRIQPTFPRTAIKRAINAAIGRCYPTIWGAAAHEFTFDAAQLTYELPENAISILGVTYEAWGSTGVWPDVNHYSFDAAADTTTYTSGKTITLGTTPAIGRTVRVLYSTTPTVLDESDTEFTDCGLRESAKFAVILGACAILLRFNDPVRLSSASAQADEYDSKKPYLAGLKVANDFEGQFQAELRAEATRLRKTYPARVVRKRL